MTNSNLIAVFNGTIANLPTQLCNARELHSFLELTTRFNDWIANRINDYGFAENEDYIIITEKTAGRPRKEYHITLDMGKELGMVERNEKGRQIRKYFIECEKRNLQPQLEEPKASPEQKQRIKQAVRLATERTGKHYQFVYTLAFDHIRTDKLENLKAKDFHKCLDFLTSSPP